MPDIPKTANTALSQAQSLVKPTGQSTQLATADVSRQTVDVIVRQLSGNLLNIVRSAGLLNKPAILPQPIIQGNLRSEQSHTLRATLDPKPILEFFSPQSVNQQKLISLNNQQIQTLLQLPPKQLLASLIGEQHSNLQKNLSVNGTVLNNTSILNHDVAPAKNTTAKSTLLIKLATHSVPIELTLPNTQNAKLNVGDKLVLSLKPAGMNWQLSVQSSQVTKGIFENSKPTEKAVSQNVLIQPSKAAEIVKAALIEGSSSKPVQLTLIPKQVLQHLAKSSLPESQTLIETLKKNPVDKLSLQIESGNKFQLKLETHKPIATIPITKEIAQALAPLKLPNQQSIIKTVNQTQTSPPIRDINTPLLNNTPNKPPTELSVKETTQHPLVRAIVQFSDSAKKVLTGKLDSQFPRPQAMQNNDRIETEKTQQRSSSQKSNIDSNLNMNANSSGVRVASNKADLISQQLNPASDLATNQTSKTKVDELALTNKQTEAQPNLKQLAEKLIQQVSSNPIETSVINPKLLNDKSQQQQLIQQLLRIVQAKAETPSKVLKNIENTLTDKEFLKSSLDLSTKQIIDHSLQQTKTALPQGKEVDAQNIKQLLTSPVLNLSTNQLISSGSNQGLINSLVTLLQISLSARLAKNQNSRTEQVIRALTSILPKTGNTSAKVTPKSLNELTQLEQKHQLMREIGRLMSGHQANKLTNAEQMLQGQESIYYNLPTLMGGILKDTELLIKREQNHQQQKDAATSDNQTWQLTMKLSVGELGELLTKAKLRPDNLELNFYASNEEVKIQVMSYLPLFKRKLKSLGIEVNKSQCQLGKIPDSLQARPYHVFQTKV
ncbi:flagellar hook-length control protein FliK [Paraglaciecola aquimarina]|uniref:Flagellar hook-length control protein FliK n=1 Tax=Paraglaciecola algarum TaxID=3050085 RepID=A0ABS9D724_9ALTE|nr:flagellar hook-length control protein FliK [Paraglaciecola sp. G1-23]MCF2948469.1 flagellar hook-length control protein FliK [Paraglaciecola sp. G1-23]